MVLTEAAKGNSQCRKRGQVARCLGSAWIFINSCRTSLFLDGGGCDLCLCIEHWLLYFDTCISHHSRMKILNWMLWLNAVDKAFCGWFGSKFHHSSLRSL